MALIYYDSFQDYTTLSQMWDGSNFCSIVGGQSRNGNQCFEKDGFNVPQVALKRLGVSKSNLTIGFAINYYAGLSGTGSWDVVVGFNDSQLSGSTWTDTNQVQLQVGNTGQVRIVTGAGTTYYGAGSTVLATSSGAPLLATGWHYVEFSAVFGSGTSGSATVRVDGVTVATISGVSTQISANASASGFFFGSGSGLNWRACDLYILDNSGAAPLNTFLGDVRVLYSTPNSDASPNAWTPSTAGAHYLMVNEASPNDATNYLSSPNVGDTELFGITALSGVPTGITSVYAVGVDIRGDKDQAAVRSLRTLVKSSATQADNGSDLALVNGVWTPYKTIFPLDPNGNAAWTVSAVNAAKIGMKVQS